MGNEGQKVRGGEALELGQEDIEEMPVSGGGRSSLGVPAGARCLGRSLRSLLGLVSLPAPVPWLFLLCARPADQQENAAYWWVLCFSTCLPPFFAVKKQIFGFSS